jgi:hypothetical protein
MQKKFEIESSPAPDYVNKENVNVRMSADISEVIEDVLFFARKELPRAQQKRITKSDLYEKIFREIVDEYQARGKESRLWKCVIACTQG